MRKRNKISKLVAEETVKTILKKYGLSPKKKLGQHFLISESILNRIIKTIDPKKKETIIEIGPGIGTLTQDLLKAGTNVKAIEIDKKFIAVLKKTCEDFEGLKIIHGNALRVLSSNQQISTADCKVVGNIPYQITSPLIRKILAQNKLPKIIVFMIQKEVAERIVAEPGDSKRGYLSVLVQLFGIPEIIDFVSKEKFYPVPAIDSAILRIAISKRPSADSWKREADSRRKLLRLARYGFSQKRKKLRNSLSAGLHLKPVEMEGILKIASIDPNLRAEDLSIKAWEKIAMVVE